ncbi:alpha/beta hydrolase [Nocardia sp. CA-135398]|uniref:alpha/beta hydrolase n=1 Tax=Nocardia sp. CA-135398 TaxID=3239977 RepID=UPI003D96E9F0
MQRWRVGPREPLGEDLRRRVRGLRRVGTFTRASVRWMAKNYVGADHMERLARDLPGGSDLTGFPPPLIINSDRDTLRASGEEFARELLEYDRPVQAIYEPGTSHGHLNRPARPEFRRTINTAAAWFTSASTP